MKFTEAKGPDIVALHALVERAYRGDSARKGWTHEADLLGGQRTDSYALKEILDDENQAILLAWRGNQLAGCVQLSRVGDRLAYLGLLTVDPDLQAGGLGKVIINAAELHASENWNAAAMEMTVIGQRGDLIAYYERRGYERTGERRPFPMDDPRYGLPKKDKLEFVVLRKEL